MSSQSIDRRNCNKDEPEKIRQGHLKVGVVNANRGVRPPHYEGGMHAEGHGVPLVSEDGTAGRRHSRNGPIVRINVL